MMIRKSIINQILDTYSTKPREFEALEGISGTYRSRFVRGYMITLEAEKILNRDTGRIIAKHTNGRGKRTFWDVWEKDRDGGYFWLCRNPSDMPPTDAVIIRDLEKELEEVKAAARSLKNTNHIIETEKRGVGRPRETENQQRKAENIKKLLADGKTNAEIMETLQIKRATFYRLKKMLEG